MIVIFQTFVPVYIYHLEYNIIFRHWKDWKEAVLY